MTNNHKTIVIIIPARSPSGYSERSQELARQLRIKAQKNLERSHKSYPVAIKRFFTKRSIKRHATAEF